MLNARCRGMLNAFPVAIIIMTTGEVKGMIEHQNTAGPSGFTTAICATKMQEHG